MPRPWLPLYCADYLADTAHLSAEESGTYLGLLMLAWLKGPLRESVNRLAVAVKGRPSVVQSVLSEYWVQTDEGWINNRLERERAHAQEVSDKRRKAREARANAGTNAGTNVPLLQVQLSTQSQSQSQSQDKDITTSVDGQAADPVDNSALPKLNGCPYQAVVELYHEVLVPPLARVFQLTPARKQAMQARWRDELPDLADWRAYFESVRHSKLVTGFRRPDGTYWKPNIDWLIRQGNLTKVAEGNYG